jgi:asparaginyl-tRNA synthetase
LSDVYTFGPTFRAEMSYTSRHLSEFWMIEPEIAFADLADDINLAEDYLKYCVKFALENCAEDLEFFENNPHGEVGLRDRLRNVLENPFKVRDVSFVSCLFRTYISVQYRHIVMTMKTSMGISLKHSVEKAFYN